MASKGLGLRRVSVRSTAKQPQVAVAVPKAPKSKYCKVTDQCGVDPYCIGNLFLEQEENHNVDPYNYYLALKSRGRIIRCNSMEEQENPQVTDNILEGPNKENVYPHEPRQPRPGSMHHRRGFYQPKPLAPAIRPRTTISQVCETQVSSYISNRLDVLEDLLENEFVRMLDVDIPKGFLPSEDLDESFPLGH